ncbi:hypothetical protein ACKI10_17445 [Streptomyces galilaeus]|uniref:Uncharacterized protein n=1 Tax=Streptomyces galilaeus TaxID=33899 RepID=A0ABW9IMW3_STRGJ
MTDRHTVDSITSDQLDQLYADLDRYEEVQGEMNEHATDQARELAELTRSRDEWKWRAEDANRGTRCQRERAEQLARLLDEVLRHFVHKGHPGEPCLQTGWISERTVARWRETLYQPTPAPAPAPASWLLAGTRDLSIPTQHTLAARPVDPETERAATDRAAQAAADSEKAAAWFAAHSQPAPAATEATDT